MIWALHGFLQSPSVWEPLGAQLAAEARLELRALDVYPARVESLWDRARALLNEIDDPAPALLAYSMGARVALHMLLLAPQKFARAVVMGPHPGLLPTEREARALRDEAWAVRLEGARTDETSWAGFLAEWDAQPVLAASGARGPGCYVAETALSSSSVTSIDPRLSLREHAGLAWGLRGGSLGAQDSLWPRLHEISVPTLWLTGQRDAKFSSLAARAVAQMSRAQHVAILGAGHRLLADAPDEVASLILDFLARR